MDNTNINIDKSSQFVNNIYDKLTYFDLYGTSVIQFILITLFVFLIYSYCQILQVKQGVADDWTNQRCKPQNIPFAGWINKPEGVSAFQYTGDNFQYCVQNILVNITGYMVQPFNYLIAGLNDIFNIFKTAIDKLREVSSSLRNKTKTLAENILNRILNMIIPIQKIFIALIDSLNKTQGIMTAGLYTMLGSYYTLQALMGAILELIIKVLVTLAAVIVGLWVIPFTWPVAATMTAVFLSIAIPLSIIIYFMTEILHIKASGLPKLRCFDKNTKLILHDKSIKQIQNINVGDILENNVRVTAKMKVDAGELRMFNLRGIIISESHILKYGSQWISVKEHPEAIEIFNYKEPYLYCINTSTKEIHINNFIFTDWDEIYDDTLNTIIKYILHFSTSKTPMLSVF